MKTNGPRSQKILIVDDVPENLRILLETLKDKYKIVTATNGEKALVLAENDSPPDLILLDVMMPGLDGYQVCARLKENPRTQNIPVIFITALGDEQDEAKGLGLGAVDFIIKPFRPALVRARVSNQLELKMHRDHMEDLVRERTKQLNLALSELSLASLDTIQRLSRAAEYKDEDTAAHIKRMSNYAAVVARRMGLSSTVVKNILYASPMHDVGKIGIPDHILLKPGKLDPDEWEIMKQHAEIGGKILEGAKSHFLGLGEVIALTHHEKWDGSGYPKGLKGSEIPLAGRITAVADVFDALTSRRPYKEAFSLEKSYRIMREGRGSHFDPAVLDAFFNGLDEILAIKETYQDSHESHLARMTKGRFQAKIG